MASEPLTFEEAGLAERFLWEAFEALIVTGDAKKLGLTADTAYLTGATLEDMAMNAYGQRRRALEKRMELARAAVLWTALAVEAGTNYYVAAMLPGDQDALDTMTTVNKLLVAPRLATGKPLFSAGVEPMGQLKRLFSLRNRIVHPKVGKHAIVGEKGIADFTPHAAGECLIAAARALSTLAAALPSDAVSRPTAADLMLTRESELRAFSRRWTDGLPEPKPKPKPRVKRAPPPVPTSQVIPVEP